MLDSHRLVPPRNKYTSSPFRLMYLPGGTEAFEKIGIVRSIPKNHIFIEPGDPPKYCYVIRKGCVVGFEYNADGEERVYHVHLPHSITQEANLFTNQPSPIYFKSIVPTELICIDKHTLLRQMVEEPELTFSIIESLSYKFFSAMDMVRELKCRDATWMLCHLLLIFADYYGVPSGDKTLIKEKVSQQVLSNLLGINRITTVRIIKRLKELGLLEQINGLYCIRTDEMADFMEEMEEDM